MSDEIYKKLKKQNGEQFAQTLRNFHNGLLEIPEILDIVRFAGREAEPLLPYLMGLLAANDDDALPPPKIEDPFVLLDRAGYDAFYADTLEKQNSIKRYFAPGELLCTFNDAARHKDYHIVHAVKKNVDQINRKDFKGKEARQDAYGTSVISIQMLKTDGFISIKNRYNHAVNGCDNTFNSNPDNIIEGLSASLQKHFNVAFKASKNPPPKGYVLMNGRIMKFHTETNNFYYGDQCWAKDGVIHAVGRGAGDALLDGFIFDNATKTLKKIDPDIHDSFADDFNRDYGGRHGLHVKDGNLMLDGKILIGVEKSQITTIDLPELTTMGDNCLWHSPALKSFSAPALTTMGDICLSVSPALTSFSAPALTKMGDYCLETSSALTSFTAPALTKMANGCLSVSPALTSFSAPALTKMGDDCLWVSTVLTSFSAPVLTMMGNNCLRHSPALKSFSAPALTKMGNDCLKAPALTTMGDDCLSVSPALTSFSAPALTTMGDGCLKEARALTSFSAPALATMGKNCLDNTPGRQALLDRRKSKSPSQRLFP